jgi:CheY-like chemotaxis protein
MSTNFKTVLVIEDDHDLRVSLRQVLEAAGFYVFTVTNGFNALELLKVIPAPKLIICDMNMPIMNGAEFIQAKHKHDDLREIPLIVMSSDHEKFGDFPEVTCLPKPLDLFKLIHHAEEKVGKEPLIVKR